MTTGWFMWNSYCVLLSVFFFCFVCTFCRVLSFWVCRAKSFECLYCLVIISIEHLMFKQIVPEQQNWRTLKWWRSSPQEWSWSFLPSTTPGQKMPSLGLWPSTLLSIYAPTCKHFITMQLKLSRRIIKSICFKCLVHS